MTKNEISEETETETEITCSGSGLLDGEDQETEDEDEDHGDTCIDCQEEEENQRREMSARARVENARDHFRGDALTLTATVKAGEEDAAEMFLYERFTLAPTASVSVGPAEEESQVEIRAEGVKSVRELVAFLELVSDHGEGEVRIETMGTVFGFQLDRRVGGIVPDPGLEGEES